MTNSTPDYDGFLTSRPAATRLVNMIKSQNVLGCELMFIYSVICVLCQNPLAVNVTLCQLTIFNVRWLLEG